MIYGTIYTHLLDLKKKNIQLMIPQIIPTYQLTFNPNLFTIGGFTNERNVYLLGGGIIVG